MPQNSSLELKGKIQCSQTIGREAKTNINHFCILLVMNPQRVAKSAKAEMQQPARAVLRAAALPGISAIHSFPTADHIHCASEGS